MGIKSEICDMVKMSQMAHYHGYSSPSETLNRIEGMSRMGWGALGSLAGLLAGAREADKAHGFKSLVDSGRFKDSLKLIGTGVKEGFRIGSGNGDLIAASVASGASKSVPLVNIEAPGDFANYVLEQKLKDGKISRSDLIEMKARAETAGNVAGDALAMKAMGNMSKPIGAISGNAARTLGANGKTVALATGLGTSAPVAAHATADAVQHFNKARKMDSNEAASTFKDAIYALALMDPSSPEYKHNYQVLEKIKSINPDLFMRLPLPSHVAPRESSASSGYKPGNIQGGSWPSWGNTVAWGAGGAGLGAMAGRILGGKKWSWRLGLLGLLLGSLHGSGNLSKIWNSVGGSK